MRFKSLNPVILVVVLMAITGACATSVNQPTAVVTSAPERTAETAYRTLSIDAFADILANRADDYKIVNVHIPYEGEVENTDASIPYNDLNALTTALPDKNARIISQSRKTPAFMPGDIRRNTPARRTSCGRIQAVGHGNGVPTLRR
jgi:hypothetical protein